MVDEVRARATRSRRWAVPALVLGTLLLFGYVGTHRVPVEGPPSAAPTPEDSLDPDLPRLTGPRGPGPEGLRLLVSGAFPQVLDAHTGRGRPVPGLRLGQDEGARLQPVPGGMVATIGAPTAVTRRSLLLPAGGGPPVPLGEDVAVVPARRGGELLVSSYGPGGTSVLMTGRAGQVRAYWASVGQVTLVRDTPAGLLVARSPNAGIAGGDLALVEPSSGDVRRRLADDRIVVAAGAAAVAYVSAECGHNCPLTVTDLATGRSRDYRMPDAGSPSHGEFSPNGRLLALGVPGQYLNGRLSVRPGFAVVLDLVRGDMRRVDGVQTPAERAADLSWWGNDRLVLGVWWSDRGRAAMWSADRPADPAQVLEVEPAGSYQYSSVTALP